MDNVFEVSVALRDKNDCCVDVDTWSFDGGLKNFHSDHNRTLVIEDGIDPILHRTVRFSRIARYWSAPYPLRDGYHFCFITEADDEGYTLTVRVHTEDLDTIRLVDTIMEALMVPIERTVDEWRIDG